MRRSVLPFLLLAAACASSQPRAGGAHAGGSVSGARSERLAPARRRALADTVRRSLRDELLAPWYPRAIDREQGGFLSQWDFEWKSTGEQDKMIVTQARHVWTTARASQVFPTDTMLKGAAAHGYRFLRDRMWDKEHG